MEKSLSIIQGLTSTDQANPIRITDAGEVKTVTRITSSPTDALAVAVNPNGGQYLNESFGYNYGGDSVISNTIVTSTDDVVRPKLLVEQGKQFYLYETYSIEAATLGTDADVISYINTTIAQWVNDHGMRYDDIKITNINNGAKNFFTIIIIRYFA